jgi:PST family polysaccharide transporter
VGTTVGVIYLATGRTDVALRVTLVAFPILSAGIAAGLPWGINGVAIGYALGSYSLFYYTALTAFRLIDLELAPFHAAVIRPALAMLFFTGVLGCEAC